MMTRIESKFRQVKSENRKAYILYLKAGDPNLESTARSIPELELCGSDIIELGVPFSYPMSDGVVIQRASERALKNHVTARDCLELVRRVREQSEIPIVLFSYLNPLLSIANL